MIGKGHDDAVGKADSLWLVFELLKRCFDVRGRLDKNELTAWLKERVRCFESSLMTASLA